MIKPLESRFQDAKPLYTESEARIEANRCLYCYDAPCTRACPADIDIPKFIKQIASGNTRGAAKTILEVNPLGLSTARVCPVEELCAGACVYLQHDARPINIGRLQRYAVEKTINWEIESGQNLFAPQQVGDKIVALIGGGPASVSCAVYLARAGVRSVIFEKEKIPGGLNTSGIAPYKLHSSDALTEIDWLCQNGIEIRTEITVGKDVSTDHLLEEFDALLIGVGLGDDTFPKIPGENESGVWGATKLIRRIKTDNRFSIPENIKKVIVIGGGNTAIDIAHELAVLGIDQVDIVYRRTAKDMPGYRHELESARKSGVRMIENARPVKITQTKNGTLELMTEHSKTGAETMYLSDWIIMAIGQSKFAGEIFPQVETDARGWIVVDPKTRRTSHLKIYAGGDCINGGKEVVNAVADGREAAFAILKKCEINRG